jgi:hypothetical protein
MPQKNLLTVSCGGYFKHALLSRATIKSEIKQHVLFTANPASARLSLLNKNTKLPILLQKIGNNEVGRNCAVLVSGQLIAHLHHSWKDQVI